MYQQLTPDTYAKYYADIIELRNDFLLPVNEPEFSVQDGYLHDGLYLSEMVETVLADTDVKRMDGLVDSVYVLVGKLVHQGHRTMSLAIANAPFEYQTIENLLFINSKLFTPEQFDMAWDIIHASNLSKLCLTDDDRKATLESYKEKGVPCKAYKTPKGWIVKATKDSQVGSDIIPKGKFLKNINYTKADLTPVFN